MANYRIPGPMCTTKNPWSIDDGTLNRCLTPPPGPICADSSLYPSKALQCLQEKKSTEPDLGFLFRQCLNPKRGLTEEDYSAAATQLKVEVAAIKAVAEVETTGNAFDEEGRPRILFERHYFHRLNAIPSPIHLPSRSLAFLLGTPSSSLALRSAVLCQNRWSRTILAKVLLIRRIISQTLGVLNASIHNRPFIHQVNPFFLFPDLQGRQLLSRADFT